METLTETLTIEMLADEVRLLRETQETLLGILTEIQREVGPLLDSLKDSPILKMLGVK